MLFENEQADNRREQARSAADTFRLDKVLNIVCLILHVLNRYDYLEGQKVELMSNMREPTIRCSSHNRMSHRLLDNRCTHLYIVPPLPYYGSCQPSQ